jgi:hypothetical protein
MQDFDGKTWGPMKFWLGFACILTTEAGVWPARFFNEERADKIAWGTDLLEGRKIGPTRLKLPQASAKGWSNI